MDPAALAYYASPGRFTTLEPSDQVGDDVRHVVAVVQGLLVYDVVARDFYGADLGPQQAEAIQLRDSAALLTAARDADPRPLDEPRPPADRIGGRCHTFSRLVVAFLRAAGVPARARCGFAGYFLPGQLEDHWVAEHWDPVEGRWRMLDAQLDATWQEKVRFEGDLLDISADEFLTAGHAWQRWRAGELDAGRCGLTAIDEHGAHWIAGNLRLDLASLNKVEMLPWDVWVAGWEPGETPTDDVLELFDAVAAMTVDPDASFGALRDRYDTDPSLRMDGTVFNVARGEIETVE